MEHNVYSLIDNVCVCVCVCVSVFITNAYIRHKDVHTAILVIKSTEKVSKVQNEQNSRRFQQKRCQKSKRNRIRAARDLNYPKKKKNACLQVIIINLVDNLGDTFQIQPTFK
jgi:hypothetical protein